MTFDPAKPIQTRSGRPAEILCTDLKGDKQGRTIAARITEEDGCDNIRRYFSTGHSDFFGAPMSFDLVNKVHRVMCFLNVYPGGEVTVYRTRRSADAGAASNRIACLTVDASFYEGEGLGVEQNMEDFAADTQKAA